MLLAAVVATCQRTLCVVYYCIGLSLHTYNEHKNSMMMTKNNGRFFSLLLTTCLLSHRLKTALALSLSLSHRTHIRMDSRVFYCLEFSILRWILSLFSLPFFQTNLLHVVVSGIRPIATYKWFLLVLLLSYLDFESHSGNRLTKDVMELFFFHAVENLDKKSGSHIVQISKYNAGVCL